MKIFFTLAACVFLVQIIHLQIIGPNEDILKWWEEYSAGQEQQITPTRGLIYDRNGNPLATNHTVYTVNISPEQVYWKGKYRDDRQCAFPYPGHVPRRCL